MIDSLSFNPSVKQRLEFHIPMRSSGARQFNASPTSVLQIERLLYINDCHRSNCACDQQRANSAQYSHRDWSSTEMQPTRGK
jgi:hypothetical protein